MALMNGVGLMTGFLFAMAYLLNVLKKAEKHILQKGSVTGELE